MATAPAAPPPKPKRRWLWHALGVLIVFAVAPQLEKVLHASPVLVVAGILIALALPIVAFLGRRPGARPWMAHVGRHPVWACFIAFLVFAAALPQQTSRSSGGVAVPPSSGTASPASAVQTPSTGPTPEELAAQAESLRATDVAKGVQEAKRIAADKEACGNLGAVADAWLLLAKAKPQDKDFAAARSATARLEKCRLKVKEDLRQGSRQLMVMQRQTWAKAIDKAFLESGLDVRVTFGGALKDRITFSWPLMSRASVYQLNKSGDLLKGATKVGFKRVTFTDGFDESWFYDLKPQDEEAALTKALGEHGLGGPLKI